MDKRLIHVRKITELFWTTWSKFYLHDQKWLDRTPDFKEGDVGLIKENNLPALSWKMGRVVKTHGDAESLVRSCRVKTVRGDIVRCITSLVRLLPSEKHLPQPGTINGFHCVLLSQSFCFVCLSIMFLFLFFPLNR